MTSSEENWCGDPPDVAVEVVGGGAASEEEDLVGGGASDGSPDEHPHPGLMPLRQSFRRLRAMPPAQF